MLCYDIPVHCEPKSPFSVRAVVWWQRALATGGQGPSAARGTCACFPRALPIATAVFESSTCAPTAATPPSPPSPPSHRSLARPRHRHRRTVACSQHGPHRGLLSLQRGAVEHRARLSWVDNRFLHPSILALRQPRQRKAHRHHRAVCRQGRRRLHTAPLGHRWIPVLSAASWLPAQLSLARLGQ